MTLQEQYEKLSYELHEEQYKLHALKKKIQDSRTVVDQIISSAEKVGQLKEQVANIESYINR